MTLTPQELAAAKEQIARLQLIAEIAERQQRTRQRDDDPRAIRPVSTLGAGTCSPFERIRWQETGRFTD